MTAARPARPERAAAQAGNAIANGTDPETARRRRRNRLLLVLMLLTPLVLTTTVVLLVTTGGPTEPTVKVNVPPGYQAITDPYFGYAVPATWTKNPIFSDSVGDLYYQGNNGWAGENERVASTAPTPGGAPSSIESFGHAAPTHYQFTGAKLALVPGATKATEYQLVRDGQVYATAIDAWDAQTQTELWLVVHAPPAVTQTILSSLTT